VGQEFFMGFRIKELIEQRRTSKSGWPTEPPLLRPTLERPGR